MTQGTLDGCFWMATASWTGVLATWVLQRWDGHELCTLCWKTWSLSSPCQCPSSWADICCLHAANDSCSLHSHIVTCSWMFCSMDITALLPRVIGRPIARGGSRGVRTNPPCSLAKFIFNETAAVQGTIIQPCTCIGIVTDAYKPSCSCYKG